MAEPESGEAGAGETPDGETPAGCLVIGVGSSLRRDDGAGQAVATRLERLGVPGLTAIGRTQLVPELIELMAAADQVVIVDADPDATAVSVRPVRPTPAGPTSRGPLSHHVDADALVGLGEALGLRIPPTFVVGIPAVDLGLGEGLSAPAASAVDAAVELLRDWRHLVAGDDRPHAPSPS